MFTISLSEGICYDMLTIYQVKADKFSKDIDASNNLLDFDCQLEWQAGYELHKQILKSDEYKDLYNINYILFDMVDAAKKDEVKASEVDHLVFTRFLAKKALQNKFFPEKCLGEQKFNYE